MPDKIYPLDRVIMNVIDRVAMVMQGNVVNVGAYQKQAVFKQRIALTPIRKLWIAWQTWRRYR